MMYYGKKVLYELHIYLFVGESNPMTGYSPSTRHAQLLST